MVNFLLSAACNSLLIQAPTRTLTGFTWYKKNRHGPYKSLVLPRGLASPTHLARADSEQQRPRRSQRRSDVGRQPTLATTILTELALIVLTLSNDTHSCRHLTPKLISHLILTMRYFNALNQLSPRPPTPKLATISLPDDSDTESRRTTGISSSGLPSSQGWWANKLGSHRAMREDIGRSNSTTATLVSSRNYENVGPPAIRTHSLSGRNATDRRMASVNGGEVPAAPFGSYRGVYRPLAMDGSLSRTPAPYVPNPSSIEDSSRTRSYSLSQAAPTHPEVPTQFPSSRAAVPSQNYLLIHFLTLD
ncbi:hypothetical protein B0H10DRAFT_1360499 [Mycena sp. CBHHK59/15]|nr:hypothetical protein B0H10DRAFT_1360499 [Mycena sp. CBHHK59/15]